MALFSLKPLGPEADQICRGCDPAFHDIYNGSGVLTFGHRPSLTPGRIASFGRDPGNDIQLPCAGPGSMVCRQKGLGGSVDTYLLEEF